MTYKQGDIILEKYRIEELIGRGAFAEVYRVTHMELNVPRALKVLHREAPGVGSTEFSDFQGRFQLEAQLGAKLNSPTPHPNLLQVHDFHKDGDQLYLEMEYAPGGSLAERIAKAKHEKIPFPIDEAVRIAIDIAIGLAELHNLDAVHRDLKPTNILFDDKGRAKVADFGLAQVPGGPSMRTRLGSLAPAHPGTPGYMSPEQENTNKYLSSASDIYALGAILFELLTGRIYKNQPGTKVSSLRDEVSTCLDDLIARSLTKVPEERPSNGSQLVDLLEGCTNKKKFPIWSIVTAGVVLLVVFGLFLGGILPPSLDPMPGAQEDTTTSQPIATSTVIYVSSPSPQPTLTFTPAPTLTSTHTPSSTATEEPAAELVELPAVLYDLFVDPKLTFSEVFDTLSDEYWTYRGVTTFNKGALEINGDNWSDLLLRSSNSITNGECMFVDYYFYPGLDDIRLGITSGEHNTESYKRIALNINDGPHFFLQEAEEWVVNDQVSLGADPETWYNLLIIVDQVGDVKIIISERDNPDRRVEWKTTPPDLEGDAWGFHALAGTGTLQLENYGECSLGSKKTAPTQDLPIESDFLACQIVAGAENAETPYYAEAWKGVIQAEAELGIQGKLYGAFQAEEYYSTLNIAIDEGCDLLIPIGFWDTDPIIAVAEENPSLPIVIPDMFWVETPNIRTSSYMANEAAYLAGYLAAGMTETGKVAVFGGTNWDAVADFMDGYALGVAGYNDTHNLAVTLLGWDIVARDGLFVGNYDNENDGISMTDELLAEGADIIFPVAGTVGIGTLMTLNEQESGWLIGSDVDWSEFYPEYAENILVSVLKKMSSFVYDSIQLAVEGNFQGGKFVGTLENGGVDIVYGSMWGAQIPADLKTEIIERKFEIISGDIKTKP